jgi:hypothetical protein
MNECDPTRKLLILLETNGDAQLDHMALKWLDVFCDSCGALGHVAAGDLRSTGPQFDLTMKSLGCGLMECLTISEFLVSY